MPNIQHEYKKGDRVFLKVENNPVVSRKEVEIVDVPTDEEYIWVRTNVPFKVKRSDITPDLDGWLARTHDLGIKIKQ